MRNLDLKYFESGRETGRRGDREGDGRPVNKQGYNMLCEDVEMEAIIF